MQPAGFYVYMHTRNDTGAPFYVGKGCGKRAWTVKSSGRSLHWQRIVAKHGREVLVVADGLDEELAFLAEVELIDKMKRLGTRLTNTSEGGEGARITDPEVLAKKNAALRATFANPDLKARLSVIHSEKWKNDELNQRRIRALKAKWATPESKAKKSAASRLLAAERRTAVECVTASMVFASMADASRWLRDNGWPKATPSKICLACKGERSNAYGHVWRYATIN